MRKLLILLIALSLFGLLSGSVLADNPEVRPLMAGQHTEVGSVTVSNDGSHVTVSYTISEAGWCLTETHLYLGKDAPSKAAPGQFPYSHSDLGCAASDSYSVALSELEAVSGDEVNVAAHAVVQQSKGKVNLDKDLPPLPSAPVNISVSYPGGDSYFNTTLSDAGEYNGTYDGWCVDTGHGIYPDRNYPALMISSYASAAANLVDKSENLDLVNYIINFVIYEL